MLETKLKLSEERQYWEEVAGEMERIVESEFNDDYYSEYDISDLESLSSLCPFDDLSEMLHGWAEAIECRMEEGIEYKYEGSAEEDNPDNFNLCVELYGDSELE